MLSRRNTVYIASFRDKSKILNLGLWWTDCYTTTLLLDPSSRRTYFASWEIFSKWRPAASSSEFASTAESYPIQGHSFPGQVLPLDWLMGCVCSRSPSSDDWDFIRPASQFYFSLCWILLLCPSFHKSYPTHHTLSASRKLNLWQDTS